MPDARRRLMLGGAAAALTLTATGLGLREGRAQSVADFYKGKQIRLVIRAQPGGNSDQYMRLLGRFLGRYIPGNPSTVPVNMPGGGGLTALNYMANVAPQDGTVVTMLTQTVPLEQALGVARNFEFDVRRLGWIGNMSDSNFFFLTSRASGIRSMADAKGREVRLAGTGPVDPAAYIAALFNRYLGTKFRLVFGYPGGVELTMAVIRNETDGRATSDPATMFAMVEGGAEAFNLLVQVGLRRQPGYEAVPLLTDLATGPDERELFGYMSKAVSLSRVVCATPGVPADRLAALRQAFDKALADPEFLQEAKKLRMEIAPMDGAAVDRYVRDIVDAPGSLIERFKAAIAVK